MGIKIKKLDTTIHHIIIVQIKLIHQFIRLLKLLLYV